MSTRQVQDMLRRQGITSADTLRRYADAHYGSEDGPLAVLRREELNLDSEDRTYKRELVIENAIIDVERLSVLNSSRVEFRNCIFAGDVCIGHNEFPVERVKFFRCICLGRIYIGGLRAGGEIHIDTVNATAMEIRVLDVRELQFTACHTGRLELEQVRSGVFEAYANRFEELEVVDCSFDKVRFDHSQAVLGGTISAFGKMQVARHVTAASSPDVFQFLSFPDMEERAEVDRRAATASTMEFLLTYSTIRADRDAFARAKHLLTLANEKRRWARLLLQGLGSLIKPARIILLMGASLLGFAFVYAFLGFEFNVANPTAHVRSLSFLECLYFSGVTFTSTGYGDFTPIGVARGLAVLEAVTGITLNSAFLVALARKYID